MSGKRLRIRARVKLSEHNLDWLAGHAVGHRKGFIAGTSDANKRDALEKASMLKEIVTLETELAKLQTKLQKQSYLVLDARRAAAAANKKALALEQAIIVPPPRSDWLHVPPFLLKKDSAIDKDKLYANLYGNTSTVTGRNPSRFPTVMTDADGGYLSPTISRRMIEQMFNGPTLLQRGHSVLMRSPARWPPGDPVFHWSADLAREEPNAPMRMLENHADADFEETCAVDLQAVSDAFRTPFQVSSGPRTPEAEEGIRRASAEGVTDTVGGHSHTIDLDIRVDDSEIRDAIVRVEALGETMANVHGISTEDFRELTERMAHLERMAGVETPEESAGEENVNSTGRADPPGEEST